MTREQEVREFLSGIIQKWEEKLSQVKDDTKKAAMMALMEEFMIKQILDIFEVERFND